jgi:prepilin-type N-terminal cleavage/methylation domain-containing protein
VDLWRIVVCGSFVTAKPERNDVDISMVMSDTLYCRSLPWKDFVTTGRQLPRRLPDGDRRRMMRRHGFTLIELLVVIAIIAILAAILFL